MSPAFEADDVRNGRCGDVKLISKLALRSCLPQFTNFVYLIGLQFISTMLRMFDVCNARFAWMWCAAFRNHIAYVVALCARKQVRRSYARRIVAGMQDIFTMRNPFVRHDVHYVGGRHETSFYINSTSTIGVSTADPIPTCGCFRDFPPKSNFKWNSVIMALYPRTRNAPIINVPQHLSTPAFAWHSFAHTQPPNCMGVL